jgi:hypothetical protein
VPLRHWIPAFAGMTLQTAHSKTRSRGRALQGLAGSKAGLGGSENR